jgi:hypothetical protein
MILRSRNLNVQEGEQQAQRKNQGPAAVKRQAAHLVVNKDETLESKDGPEPKRTCRDQQHSSILQDFSNNLCIDSANRPSLGFNKEEPKQPSPPPVVEFEFDKENAKDYMGAPEYVQDIFLYYKYREVSL